MCAEKRSSSSTKMGMDFLKFVYENIFLRNIITIFLGQGVVPK